jgi:hypothetical protein
LRRRAVADMEKVRSRIKNRNAEITTRGKQRIIKRSILSEFISQL